MGRLSSEIASRYDDLGSPTACYYCSSGNVRGFDYTPHPSVLRADERGSRVRACTNCLPRLYYFTVTKNNPFLSLMDKMKLLEGRRSEPDVAVQRPGFVQRAGLLAPKDMMFFSDTDGKPSQYFVMGPDGPTQLIQISELWAAQFWIAASILALDKSCIEWARDDVQSRISAEAFAALDSRLNFTN